MIKRLYLANGTILAPLDKSSENISVDGSIADLLQDNLNLGDHCYLTLLYEEDLEVIKIRRDYSGFRVDRGQDGTNKYSFPTGTQLIYRLTSAEIADAAVVLEWNIYASGYGFATVTGGSGTWEIGLDAIHVDTVGGVITRVEDNELVISDNIGAFGCCDGGLTGAPFIPGPFFYLTSMLYTQESIEAVTPTPRDKLGSPIPPVTFDSQWWLLTQPSVLDKYVGHDISLLDWENYGGEQSFTAPTDKYILPTVGVGVFEDWLEYGGEQSFIAPSEKYVETNCYPLEMLMYGGQIDYPSALDKYILPTISLLDWTLS